MKTKLLLLLVLLFAATVHAAEPENRPVRILAIGNSFSADALEDNLHALAAADGTVCEIGNLYIGGCSLERHVRNARTDAPAYEYRRIDRAGNRTNTPGVAMREALEEGDWDFISIQQASPLSGLYETYTASIGELLDSIRRYCPEAHILFHQTWAYAQHAGHPGFATYGNDQQTMYAAIMEATERVAADYGLTIVPAGTALQNLRRKAGDIVDRDGYHLNPLGRYAAACVWFEVLFGRDVRPNGYERPDLDPELQRLAREAAHAAVTQPFAVTAE